MQEQDSGRRITKRSNAAEHFQVSERMVDHVLDNHGHSLTGYA
jgi:hypothetical protein